MDKTLGKEYTNPHERRAFLRDNCDSVVEKGYMKQFAPQAIQVFKDRLSEVSIEISEVEDAKKAAATQYAAELKPMQVEKSTLLRNIKERAEYVKEECYKFVDHENRMVGFYNSDGDLVESRPASPDEYQRSIFQMSRSTASERAAELKTGTED